MLEELQYKSELRTSFLRDLGLSPETNLCSNGILKQQNVNIYTSFDWQRS